MTTPYNQLRQLLTDRLPHLKELSFGCEIRCSDDFFWAVLYDGKKEVHKNQIGKIRVGFSDYFTEVKDLNELSSYTIIGHPPTLQDILLAIDIKNNGLDTGYRTLVGGLDFKADMGLTYDLTKLPKDQTDEILLAIVGLIS